MSLQLELQFFDSFFDDRVWKFFFELINFVQKFALFFVELGHPDLLHSSEEGSLFFASLPAFLKLD